MRKRTKVSRYTKEDDGEEESEEEGRKKSSSPRRKQPRRNTNMNKEEESAGTIKAIRRRRRSGRGISSLSKLALSIVQGKEVVIITGAGLSVASGIRPFRSSSASVGNNNCGASSNCTTPNKKKKKKDKRKKLNHNHDDINSQQQDQPYDHQQQQQEQKPKERNPLLGIWNSVIWTKATRKEFRKDPLKWYNEFWLKYFPCDSDDYYPNDGHLVLATLQQRYPNVKIITQNIDGLHHSASRIVLSTSNETKTKTKLRHDGNGENDDTENDKQGKQQKRQEEKGEENDAQQQQHNRNNTSATQTNRVTSDTTTTNTDNSERFNIVEAHGRLGLYKCIPDEDSDTDSSDDEDDDRLVHLGHHRKRNKYNEQQKENENCSLYCKYQMMESLKPFQLKPADVRDVLVKQRKTNEHGNGDTCSSKKKNNHNPSTKSNNHCREDRNFDELDKQSELSLNSKKENNDNGNVKEGDGQKLELDTKSNNHDDGDNEQELQLKSVPSCPNCGNAVLPQALLFDEGYHSHDYYQFYTMEKWLSDAKVVVFCGTSFTVQITQVALEHCRAKKIPVYNFNLIGCDTLKPTPTLDVENILGPCSNETLPKLLVSVQQIEQQRKELGVEVFNDIVGNDDYELPPMLL